MTWGNVDLPLAERIRERLLRSHQDQTSREENLQEERRKERVRIARDLHDTLLQGFLSASMQLCLADESLPADSPAKPVLRRALDLMSKGIDEGRAALLGLRSPVLAEGSLEKALCDVRDDFTPGERARVRIVVLGETAPLDSAVQQQIYWIAREAMLNALRHSEATRVEAEVEYLRRKLRVVVRDNGSGIDPQLLQSGSTSHFGLTGMRERAASIGAKIRVWSKHGSGTEVEISISLSKAHHGAGFSL
jgi:signal transduction histidine kinase